MCHIITLTYYLKNMIRITTNSAMNANNDVISYVLMTSCYHFCSQCVKDNSFDQHAAIYHLLADKFLKHPRGKGDSRGLPSAPLPQATRTERRSSITTGVGESIT